MHVNLVFLDAKTHDGRNQNAIGKSNSIEDRANLNIANKELENKVDKRDHD
jgi:hypothetical protein